MRLERLARMALWLALASPTLASTFVIDDDGGPGVDFTDIAPAIAAASPGDVLLVRSGSYSAFTLTKGLSLLGEPGVTVTHTSDVVVTDLPLGQVAVLTDFSTQASHARIRIEDCAGTVIVQRVTGPLVVRDSIDVRMWSVNGSGCCPSVPGRGVAGAGLYSSRSRVELVQSAMIGSTGYAGDPHGDPGSPGVFAAGDWPGLGTQLVHIARTSCIGGAGGFAFGFDGHGGRGGHGVHVGSDGALGLFGCDVVIAGGHTSTIRGGFGGTSASPCDGMDGVFGGSALFVRDPKARYSGVTLVPGVGCSGAGDSIETEDPSYVVAPGFEDPTLAVSGSSAPGGRLVFQIRGHPRSKAFLNYGKTPSVRESGASQIDVLVDVIRGLKLGPIPTSGQIDRAFPIPSNATVGSLFVFQAVVVLPTGELRRTNSVPVIVR